MASARIEASENGPGSLSDTPPGQREQERPRSSLRGAGAQTAGDDPPSGNTRLTGVQIEREIKLTLNDLPLNFEEYGNWRSQTDALILGAGADPELSLMYLEEVDSSSSDELKANQVMRSLKALDVKVYTSVIACIKGREHNEHKLKLRSEHQRGNGRLSGAEAPGRSPKARD